MLKCNLSSSEVTIPENVEYEGHSYKVTSVGDDAFNGCTGLKSVNIPNSITPLEIMLSSIATA